MTVHFIHVGKTGGTAIKAALRRAGFPQTPFGQLVVHRHRQRLVDLPREDYAFFCVRDPVSRFISGFSSRQRMGMPRFYFEWTPAELRAFEVFGSAQELASALASRDRMLRGEAERAMQAIRHLRPQSRQLGTLRQLRRRMDRVVFIGRTETLSADWPQLVRVLALPPETRLPTGPVRAHRGNGEPDKALDDDARDALVRWYAKDYRLVGLCDRVRDERGWGEQYLR